MLGSGITGSDPNSRIYVRVTGPLPICRQYGYEATVEYMPKADARLEDSIRFKFPGDRIAADEFPRAGKPDRQPSKQTHIHPPERFRYRTSKVTLLPTGMTCAETRQSTAALPLVSDELCFKIQKVLRSGNEIRGEKLAGSAADARSTVRFKVNATQQSLRPAGAVPASQTIPRKSATAHSETDTEGYARPVYGGRQAPAAQDDAELGRFLALTGRGPQLRTWQRWRRFRQQLISLEPSWRIDRPYVDGSFRMLLADPASVLQPDTHHSANPCWMQVERQLLRDLQFALLGYPPSTKEVATVSLVGHGQSCGVRFHLRRVVYGVPLPTATHALVQSILDIAGALCIVRDFAETCSFYNQGMVRQALGAALKRLLRRYDALFLDHWGWTGSTSPSAEVPEQLKQEPPLTIQRLWIQLQPIQGAVLAISSMCLAERVRKQGGGALLCALYDLIDPAQVRWGVHNAVEASLDDPKALKEELFWAAFQPFWAMLEQWLDHGVLSDPFDEFCVQRDTTQIGERLADDFNAAFWESGYTLRASHLPNMLQQVGTPILLAGKYQFASQSLEVMQQAVPGERLPVAISMQVAPEAGSCRDASGTTGPQSLQCMTLRITNALATASKSLVRALILDGNLMATLTQFKNCFLLGRVDFLDDVLSGVPGEILAGQGAVAEVLASTPSAESVRTAFDRALGAGFRLQNTEPKSLVGHFSISFLPYSLSSQLLRVLAVSSAAAPWSSAEAAELASLAHPTRTRDAQLCIIDAVSLDYHANWPYSVILNRRVITKFQLLFRQLSSLHLCLRRLGSIRLQLQRARTVCHKFTGETRHAAILSPLYCSLLQQTIHALLYAMTWTTIETQWMRWQQTLDELGNSFRHAAKNSHEQSPRENRTSSVDELIRALNEFLDASLYGCFLMKARSFRCVRQIVLHVHHYIAAVERCAGRLDPAFVVAEIRTLRAVVRTLVGSVAPTHPLRAWYDSVAWPCVEPSMDSYVHQ
jgi:hypothetical protein